jgi:hypothetical protein
VVPARRLARDHRRREQPSDDRLAVDVLERQLIPAFERRIGMDPHVAVRTEHEDVRLAPAPAAASPAEVVERRFALARDQRGGVVHQRHQRARFLVLVDLIVGSRRLGHNTDGDRAPRARHGPTPSSHHANEES